MSIKKGSTVVIHRGASISRLKEFILELACTEDLGIDTTDVQHYSGFYTGPPIKTDILVITNDVSNKTLPLDKFFSCVATTLIILNFKKCLYSFTTSKEMHELLESYEILDFPKSRKLKMLTPDNNDNTPPKSNIIEIPVNQQPMVIINTHGGCIEEVQSNIKGLVVSFLDTDIDGMPEHDPNLLDLSPESDRSDLMYMSTHYITETINWADYNSATILETLRLKQFTKWSSKS